MIRCFLFCRIFLLLACSALMLRSADARGAFAWNAQSQIVLTEGYASHEDSAEVVAYLSEVLARITGTQVEAVVVDATAAAAANGIVLALPADFPQQAEEASLGDKDSFARENYRLLSSPEQVLVLGATKTGVRNGVADLMYRMGYRNYFSAPHWEILPTAQELKIDIDTVVSPAYVSRNIFLTSFMPGDDDEYNGWRFWNRQGGGFALRTQHAYDDIYRRNRDVFDANPDYFTKFKGKRQHKAAYKKFNAASPEVLEILVEDAKTQFEQNPLFDSISMDPSDFGGWDDTGEAFERIGSASNQAVTMANAVAKNAAAPLGKYVGMYAYYDHQHAPTIDVEPNLIVSFATRFLRPGRDLVQSIEQWQARGLRSFGIRDYASYWEWDLAMPGRAQGGDISYLKQSIAYYNKIGARFYTSEYAGSWGPYGLGVYTASRLLWNPQEDTDAIVEDFLQKSFGPAAEVMRKFYSQLNGADSVAARQISYPVYYGQLLEAVALAEGQPQVLARLESLLAYVRYMELVSELDRARMADKQPALDDLYEWMLRIDSLHMVSTRGGLLRPRGGGIRRLLPKLTHPSMEATQQRLAELAQQPVTLAELTAFAAAAVEREQPLNLPALPVADVRTSSPAVRNGGAFVFPMGANETVSVQISFRLFGFSWLPRYGVIAPDGTLGQMAQMQTATEVVTLRSTAPGNYLLVMDASPNLVRIDSQRTFYLLPSADSRQVELVRYAGGLSLNVPQGRSLELVVSGQGKGEVLDMALLAADGTELISQINVNGIDPVAFEIGGGDAASGADYQLNLKRPTKGHFEDMFIRMQGGEVLPLGIGSAR